MTKLRISPTLSLPLDFVTSTQAILAKKGKGKTYKASVQAEELLDAHQQIVAIDPTGAWYGLRSSADGKHDGYPVTIFGGEHGDIALETTAGEVIAEAIATDHFSAIIDLSLFRKGEALRFMAAFMETLYRKNRAALHLFIDEADVVAPQKTFSPEQARALGATDDLVRRGRIRGIGCTLITQRPQVLNKDVLSQIDMLTALGMNHPKDIGAIKDWVAVHGDEAQAKQMIADLPALPQGEAWVWAPAADIFKRITFRDRKTFDSGRTPKAGERTVVPKKMAPVDLARLGEAIAGSVERAKANDPKALKDRVAQLEKQLAAKAPARVETKVIEKPLVTDAQLKRVEQLIAKLDDLNADWTEAADRHRAELDKLLRRADDEASRFADEVAKLRAALTRSKSKTTNGVSSNRAIAADVFANDGMVTKLVGKHQIRVPRTRANSGGPMPDGSWSPAQHRLLDTIATLAELGIESTRTVLAAWLGMHPNSKSYVNNLGALRSAGLVDGFTLTDTGRRIATANVPKSSEAVREMLVRPLSPAQRRIVELVLERGEVGREELADALEMHPNSKSLVNNIGALRGRALLTKGWPVCAERVFEVGAA